MSTDNNRGLRVGVFGGSIGGLSAAIALRKSGANVTVFERREAMTEEGAAIALRSDGVEGLSKLGLEIPRSQGFPWRYGTVKDGNVKMRAERVAYLNNSTYSSLREMLYREATAIGVEYFPNTSVKSIATEDFHPRIRFDTGEIECDVVVAADGIDSRTRAMFFPSMEPQDTGITLLRGFVREEVIKRIFSGSLFKRLDAAVTQIFASSPKGGYWVRAGGRGFQMFQWVLYVPTSHDDQTELLTDDDGVKQRWSIKKDKMSLAAKQMLRQILESYYPKELVPLADAGGIMVHRVVKMLVPSMVVGKVCILGDAAHVTPPFAASGGTLAIADGVELARQLGGLSAIEDRLTSWSNLRMKEARAILSLSDRIQAETLAKPPDLVKATVKEVEAWIERVDPGASVRVYDLEAQPYLF